MSATVELEAGKPFNVRKRVGGVFCFVLFCFFAEMQNFAWGLRSCHNAEFY